MEFTMDSRGRVREKPVYTGAYYCFEAAPAAVRKSTALLVVTLLAAAAATFVPLIVKNEYARAFYVFLPQAFAMLPLYMFSASVWRILTVRGDVIHEHRDRIVNRLRNAAIFFLIVSALSLGGAIAFFILGEPKTMDWAMIAVNALRLPIAAVLLKLRKQFAMRQVDDSPSGKKD